MNQASNIVGLTPQFFFGKDLDLFFRRVWDMGLFQPPEEPRDIHVLL
jgi:hypothetical protein